MKEIKTKEIAIFIFLMLVLIVLVFAGIFHSNRNFNKIKRTVELSKLNNFSHCSVTVKPRGGEGDSWVRTIEIADQNGNVTEKEFVGVTYDAKVSNLTEYDFYDWSLKMKVDDYILLNTAWCGDMEISQKDDKNGYKSQSLDLRNPLRSRLIIKYQVFGGDLFIPLQKDDTFTYQPYVPYKENQILPSQDPEKPNSVSFGFIIYVPFEQKDNLPDFSQSTLTYRLRKPFEQEKFILYLRISLLLWLCCAIAFVFSEWRMHALYEAKKHDDRIIDQVMNTFIGFIDAKDPNTNGHSLRVAKYSQQIAEKLKYSPEEAKRLYYIGLMHDCGKIGVPENILRKPAKLDNEEFEIIKQHTLVGSEILQNFTEINNIGRGALCHHERYDGKGYPQGLEGERIPIEGRIICIADAFDAMNSNRCYRDKLPKDYIINQLEQNRGKQFDPKLTDIFIEMIKDGTIDC
ncbi:MAG: HD-GYP domain-containing protein [Treponemataceae bacterium]|nr:HD-GYP domain-containing protein [Treponemataceae bacterium]